MTDQQLNIVLIAILGIMILQYVIFYLRGVGMKIPFLIQTVIVIVCLMLPTEDSVVYSICTLLLFVWMGMVLLGIWKLLFYKASLVKTIKLANKAPTDEHIKKLAKHIDRRRIKLKWLVKKDERLVDTIVSLYKDTKNSTYVTPETHMYFERILIDNGFEIVMENAQYN